MKLASFYKNSLIPSYERIGPISKVIIEKIESLQKEVSDPELIDDSKPFVRRQEIMNEIIKFVKSLPREFKMSTSKRNAGGNFDYLVVHFEDLNLNLVPMHLLSKSKLPKTNGYRGDISAFNFAIMKERGMASSLEFQSYLDFDSEMPIITEPVTPSNIEDIPFGLLLIYDGTNAKTPIRLAALTPNQENYIFCDDVELLREYSNNKVSINRNRETVKRRKLKLETFEVNEYKSAPDVILKNKNKKSDDNENTI